LFSKSDKLVGPLEKPAVRLIPPEPHPGPHPPTAESAHTKTDTPHADADLA